MTDRNPTAEFYIFPNVYTNETYFEQWFLNIFTFDRRHTQMTEILNLNILRLNVLAIGMLFALPFISIKIYILHYRLCERET